MKIKLTLSDFLRKDKRVSSKKCFEYLKKYNPLNVKRARYMRQFYKQAPVELETKYSIEGISTRWNMPNNSSLKDIEMLVKTLLILEECKEISIDEAKKELFEKFLSLNPEIDYPLFRSKFYDTMLGCTSSFNLNDIRDYILVGGFILKPYSYQQRVKLLEMVLNHHLEWVPCEKTLDLIESKLLAKHVRPVGSKI